MRLVRALIFLALLGALIAGTFWLRQSTGETALREAMVLDSADQAWLNGLPKPDGAWRESVWMWMKSPWPQFKAGQRGEALETLNDKTWHVRGESMPDIQRQRHEFERAHMKPFSTLLEADQACISSASWFHHALADKDGHQALRIPNMIALRSAVNWYAREALSADDPVAPLKRLDALVASLRPAGSLIDALILPACAAVRDDAYTQLALSGNLARNQRDAWLEESPPFRKAVSEALKGERIGFWHLYSKRLLEDSDATFMIGDQPFGKRLGFKWNGHRDMADILGAYRAYEHFCMGPAETDVLDAVQAKADKGGELLRTGLPSFSAMVLAIVRANTQHNLRRLLVHGAAASVKLGHVPETEAKLRELLGWHETLLGGDRWTFSVGYEAVGTNRLRFVPREDTSLSPGLRKMIQPSLMSPLKRNVHWNKHKLRVAQEAAEYQLTP